MEFRSRAGAGARRKALSIYSDMKTGDYESLSPRVRRFLRAADALGGTIVSFFHPRIRRIEAAKSAVQPFVGARKVLLARCDGIGDLVLSTPAIRALRARLPDAEIHLMVGPWAKDVAGMVPGVDKVIPYAPWGYRALRAARGNLFPGEDLRMAARIRRERYDLAVDLRGDLLTLLPMAFWRIPERVGRATRGGGFALTRIVPPARPGREHEVDRTLDVVAALGARTENRAIELNVPADAVLGARAFLERRRLEPEKTLVFGPGAQWPWKLWPRRNFAELGRTLVAAGYRIVVVGAGGESAMIEEIVRAGGTGLVGCAGPLDLRELAGLFLCAAASWPWIPGSATSRPRRRPRASCFSVPARPRSSPRSPKKCASFTSPARCIPATSAEPAGIPITGAWAGFNRRKSTRRCEASSDKRQFGRRYGGFRPAWRSSARCQGCVAPRLRKPGTMARTWSSVRSRKSS